MLGAVNQREQSVWLHHPPLVLPVLLLQVLYPFPGSGTDWGRFVLFWLEKDGKVAHKHWSFGRTRTPQTFKREVKRAADGIKRLLCSPLLNTIERLPRPAGVCSPASKSPLHLRLALCCDWVGAL